MKGTVPPRGIGRSGLTKVLVGLVVLAGLVWLLYAIRGLLPPLIIACVLAYVLSPVLDRLESLGVGRELGIAILYLAILGIVIAFLAYGVPAVSKELSGIRDDLPTYVDRFRSQVRGIESYIEERVPAAKNWDIAERAEAGMSSQIGRIAKQAPLFMLGLFSKIIFVILIPFVAFFLMKEGPTMKRRIVELVPNRHFEMVLNLIYRIDQQIGGYIRGLAFVSIVVAILWTITLKLAGLWCYPIKYFILVGVIAGLTNLIPFFGPLLTICAAVLISLVEHGMFQAVIPVLVVFVIVQILDGALISPIVVAKSVDLHPVFVLLVVLIGGQLFGIPGMLMGVPVVGVLKVTVQTLYESSRRYRIT